MQAKQKILIIDNCSEECKSIEIVFLFKYELLKAVNGEQALGVLSKDYVDLIILDISESNDDSLRFLRFIRYNTEYKRIPLLLICDTDVQGISLCGRDFKIGTYLLRPLKQEELLQKVTKVLDRERNYRLQLVEYYKLVKEARHDDLTGLYKRSTGCQLIQEELQQGGQNALLLIDIDDFKTVNDRFGHALGDKVLIALAGVLKNFFRNSDILMRLGGDEFCIFIADIADDTAWLEKKCSNLLDQIEALSVEGIYITCSLGAAKSPEDGTSFEELYRKADGAMYNIKGESKKGFRIFNSQASLLSKADASRAKLELLNSPALAILGCFNQPELPLFVISRALTALLGYPSRPNFLQAVEDKFSKAMSEETAALAYKEINRQLAERNSFLVLLPLEKKNHGTLWLLLKGIGKVNGRNEKELLAVGIDVSALVDCFR